MVNATGKTYKFTPKKIIFYLFIIISTCLINFVFIGKTFFQISGWRFVNDQPTLEKAKLIRTIFNP